MSWMVRHQIDSRRARDSEERLAAESKEVRERLHAANNALTIAQIALRRISASDTTSDIDGNHEGPLAKIADEALTAIEKAIR